MSFLLRVAERFADLGREVEVDTSSSTLAVEADATGYERLLVVVRSVSQAVTLYAVHPRPVPEDRFADVAELCARANSTEFTVALELDFAHGTFAVRAGLETYDVDLSDAELESLLAVLVVELESVAGCYGPAVDAVGGGDLTPAAAATQALAARRDEHLAEAATTLAELEARD
ncbi:MAG: YbjN domain-containing protein [Actinomycetales bacterium]|nr:YbjN domain-containing protein [Actinomycetales bacterium]